MIDRDAVGEAGDSLTDVGGHDGGDGSVGYKFWWVVRYVGWLVFGQIMLRCLKCVNDLMDGWTD